jgi:hypothetical protein
MAVLGVVSIGLCSKGVGWALKSERVVVFLKRFLLWRLPRAQLLERFSSNIALKRDGCAQRA